VARYDKYDPISGGFRAALAADWLSADLEKPIGVGLDTNGKVVKGAGNTGVIGVLCLTMLRYAGDIVDVMTEGEIVEVETLTAGTAYYAVVATGVLSNTATANKRVGHTVEASRLVVRVGSGAVGG